MKRGVHLADFTWPEGLRALGNDLKTVARAVEAVSPRSTSWTCCEATAVSAITPLELLGERVIPLADAF